MNGNKINLKIITHEKEVFNEEVDAIYSKSVEGEFGILPDHQPFMGALDIGVTKIEKDGNFEFISTMGGIFQFKNNEAIILTDLAERGSDIDLTRAKSAKERAEARIGSSDKDVDTGRAQLALAKAIARINAGTSK
jgi:F-type H+-transporting ATPase subunit epsilon